MQNGRVAMSAKLDSEILHKRMGHASHEKLRHIFSLNKDVEYCDSCLRAKQTRLPFPHSSIKTHSCFELLHCDIWGGYKYASFSGAHYFLSIVDDFSRGVWVFLMKHKSEVEHFLTKFCHLVQNQFEKKVKRIRTDNGPEFQSRSMLKFYHEQGIILETSCTDTPQQNKVVERKHRHILEIARALRFEVGLPIKFWGECVLTATYIINTLPSRAIGNQTPYEILMQRVPSYDHIRIFGCLAYARDNKKGGDKFGERGRKCIFVGYPNTQKGYRVYDLNSHQIFTCDVRFFETIFPFKHENLGGQVMHNRGRHIIFDDEVDCDQIPLADTIGSSTQIDSIETTGNEAEHHDQHTSPTAAVDNSTSDSAIMDQISAVKHNQLEKRVKTQPKHLQGFVVDSSQVNRPFATHDQLGTLDGISIM